MRKVACKDNPSHSQGLMQAQLFLKREMRESSICLVMSPCGFCCEGKRRREIEKLLTKNC